MWMDWVKGSLLPLLLNSISLSMENCVKESQVQCDGWAATRNVDRQTSRTSIVCLEITLAYWTASRNWHIQPVSALNSNIYFIVTVIWLKSEASKVKCSSITTQTHTFWQSGFFPSPPTTHTYWPERALSSTGESNTLGTWWVQHVKETDLGVCSGVLYDRQQKNNSAQICYNFSTHYYWLWHKSWLLFLQSHSTIWWHPWQSPCWDQWYNVH